MGNESSALQVTLRYLKETTHSVEGVLDAAVVDLVSAGLCTAPTTLLRDALARQEQSPTGMAGQIAIPHCRSTGVSSPAVVILRLENPVDFGGPDGSADIVFFIAIPDGADKSHMRILSSLARAVVRADLANKIRNARDGEEVTQLVRTALAPKPKADSSQVKQIEDAPVRRRSIVAITSCPTGVAHTYLAADALKKAAKQSNISLAVETQGATDNSVVSNEDIARAEVAIIASSVGIAGEHRLDGLPVLRVDARAAVDDPTAVLARALELVEKQPHDGESFTGGLKIGQALLSGVSALIPLLMIAGVALSLGRLVSPATQSGLSSLQLLSSGNDQVQFLGSALSQVETPADMLVTVGLLGLLGSPAVMAMAVASSLSPRVGSTPGLVLGVLAVVLGTGFLGGLVAGVLAGIVARALQRWKAPPSVSPAVPIVVIPVAVTITALAFYGASSGLGFLYDTALAAYLNAPTAVTVGVAIALSVAVNWDFGGRINKVAYGIAVVGLTTATPSAFVLMAATMVSGMVAPIALGIATKKKSTIISGLLFITEPVLEFIAYRPRAAWAMRAGGAASAAISAGYGAGTLLPHGGVFAVVGTQANPMAWMGALLVGVAVTAVGIAVTQNKKRGASAPR